jgi:hypothetical protein
MRLSLLGVVLCVVLVFLGCGGRADIQCEHDSNCDLSGGGRCLAASSGNQWCAYPDPECPGGFRYSNQDVGDDASLRWSEPMLLTNVNSDGDERFPVPSADDLELYFGRLSLDPPYGDIYVARRASTTQPFGTPTAVTEVNGSNSNEIFAVPSHSGLELFVSGPTGIVAYSRATTASQWGGGASTGIIANGISLSPDDLTMYIVARCGPDVHGGTGPCFFQSTRTSVGTQWSTPAYLPWDGDTQWNSTDVSSDGLHLLVSGIFSATGIPIAEEERASVTEGWSNTNVISPLDLETTNTEARWNADGTEIYLSAQPAAHASTKHDIYISVLQ